MITLPRLIRARFVAVLAVVFAAVEIPELIQGPTTALAVSFALWLVGAVLTFIRLPWGALLLALLAALDFWNDIILGIPGLKNFSETSPVLQTLGGGLWLCVGAMLIEVVFLVCFLYFGVYTLSQVTAQK